MGPRPQRNTPSALVVEPLRSACPENSDTNSGKPPGKLGPTLKSVGNLVEFLSRLEPPGRSRSVALGGSAPAQSPHLTGPTHPL